VTAEGQKLASGGNPRPAVSERVRQKERTRAALITAARQLILDGARITMMGAATAVGVSEATAYRHFPDLPSLLREAFTGLAQRGQDAGGGPRHDRFHDDAGGSDLPAPRSPHHGTASIPEDQIKIIEDRASQMIERGLLIERSPGQAYDPLARYAVSPKLGILLAARRNPAYIITSTVSPRQAPLTLLAVGDEAAPVRAIVLEVPSPPAGNGKGNPALEPLSWQFNHRLVTKTLPVHRCGGDREVSRSTRGRASGLQGRRPVARPSGAWRTPGPRAPSHAGRNGEPP
jgi:AcrR family transcriptional regulator